MQFLRDQAPSGTRAGLKSSLSKGALDWPARRVVVSTAQGDQPVWKRDGSAIYYVNRSGRLHRVAVKVTLILGWRALLRP